MIFLFLQIFTVINTQAIPFFVSEAQEFITDYFQSRKVFSVFGFTCDNHFGTILITQLLLSHVILMAFSFFFQRI